MIDCNFLMQQLLSVSIFSLNSSRPIDGTRGCAHIYSCGKRLRRFKTWPSYHLESIYTSCFVSPSVSKPIYHFTAFALWEIANSRQWAWVSAEWRHLDRWLLFHPSSLSTNTGILFLQLGEETRRVHLTHELTSLETLRALIVHMFPQRLTMAMLRYVEPLCCLLYCSNLFSFIGKFMLLCVGLNGCLRSPSTALLIKDETRNVFYELEDPRDVQDRCVIKIYCKEPVYGTYPGHHNPHLANGDLRVRSLCLRSSTRGPDRWSQTLTRIKDLHFIWFDAAGQGCWLADSPSSVK